MAGDAAMTKFPAARALLILGVLASLCVSDNVGPRLLPLPVPSELASVPGPSDRAEAATHAPAQGGNDGARVEMVSAPQGRAGAVRQSPQAAAHAQKFDLAIPYAPRLPRREPRTPFAETSALLSRPKGRAPPRLA
jgi:hypothetical protein